MQNYFSAYGLSSIGKIKDYPIIAQFTKGDNFIVEHDNCIESIILFMNSKRNDARILKPNQ